MINILVTSVGRRVELVQRLIFEKNNFKNIGNIIGADMNALAPALYFCDKKIVVPPINSNEYLDALADICVKEEVKLIIPTIDTELEILSNNLNIFNPLGTDVLISSNDLVKRTHNKILTYHLFRELGLPTPESYWKGKDYENKFPCFIKPVSGSSSINSYKVKSEKELMFYKERIVDYIVQEYIEGEEFTIDIFCDFKGNPIYITPRIRLEIRSGEVYKTIIKYEDVLLRETLYLIGQLKPKGPITLQVIKQRETGKFFYIEINSRFGGGSPLSMMAGANSISALYSLLAENPLEYKERAAKENSIILRFDQSIMIN